MSHRAVLQHLTLHRTPTNLPDSMTFLYPKMKFREFCLSLGYTLLGTIFAGLYGVIHDQITYTISPEYFTRMKFDQFSWADTGLPLRWFVAEIGFLATWWVGLIGTWFIARLNLSKYPPELAKRKIWVAFGMMLGVAVCAALLGYLAGPMLLQKEPTWGEALESLYVKDPVAFSRVAAIHTAGYFGALIGWIAAMTHSSLRNKKP